MSLHQSNIKSNKTLLLRQTEFDRGIPSNKRKTLLTLNSLFLGEPSSHKPNFEIFYIAICCMLDLAQPLRVNHGLPFWSRHCFIHIILHDGVVLLQYGILPNLTFCLLETWRLTLMMEEISCTQFRYFFGGWITWNEVIGAPTWSCASYSVWVNHLDFFVEPLRLLRWTRC